MCTNGELLCDRGRGREAFHEALAFTQMRLCLLTRVVLKSIDVQSEAFQEASGQALMNTKARRCAPIGGGLDSGHLSRGTDVLYKSLACIDVGRLEGPTCTLRHRPRDTDVHACAFKSSCSWNFGVHFRASDLPLNDGARLAIDTLRT